MSAIKRVYQLSKPLQELLGKSELSRAAAVKEFWIYVKANNLQDPVNKKLIVPNEKMKNVFQVENKIKFTEVFGLLSKHLQQK